MGPIRGFKRKKRAEKKVDQNVLAALLRSQPQPLDWWDDFSQRITGPLSQSKNPNKFESVFKISRKTFNYICSLVRDNMMARPSNFNGINGKPLSLNDQVAVALRRLSSGESLSSVGESFGMNQSTVSQITWRFVEAIEERGIHHLCWPSTEVEMEELKSKFQKIRGLPNCCGAIDITHIMMTLPTMDSTDDIWLDHEKNCSMILQAVVDPEMRFRDIITGWPGSLSDDLVLRSSGFFKLSEEGKRLNGKEVELSQGKELREYIIGDAGFPLLPWLLTPYQGRGLLDFQSEFNKRHFATRMVAQRALARLKEMWKIIQGVMWKPDKHRLPRIILACCILHNIVIDMEDEVQDEMPLSHHHDSNYRQQTCQSADNTAVVIRENLSLCLSGKLTS
ncbi:protein ALP1-like [Juglans microcarpa x Juglans regia]|uniref:protein ALP1-like n=1 Tax=Juglans microcarpa x Juglans regia TaxID=2249226 RepID=UPI001B7EC972|nr:protein ALP1-like [Juglans microcarpa x Juglans regia]XP_041000422.1 protein ALP1-like [Juglans microcarpa x Juglans regia]